MQNFCHEQKSNFTNFSTQLKCLHCNFKRNFFTCLHYADQRWKSSTRPSGQILIYFLPPLFFFLNEYFVLVKS